MATKETTATILAVASVFILLQGCYSYHVSTSHFDPSTHYNKKFVSSFFWGLVQQNVVASNCDSLQVNSLDEVHVKTNLGYAVLTVLTLGIWCPMTVEWKCAKPCPREGDIH